MSAKIVIVGTCHTLQCGVGDYTDSQREKYKSLIIKLCKSHYVNLIAEEMCFYGLSQHQVSETVAANLAEYELCIAHSYIDIPFEGRALLNVGKASISNFKTMDFSKTKNSENRETLFRKTLLDPMRELYWFAKLLSLNQWPALIICGDNHVENIRKLIQKVNKDAFGRAYRLAEYLGK